MKSSTSNHSGTRLFFIEFLIVLFFFLIISTVCLRLFVQSHSMTKHTEELFQAQEAAASVAELLKAGQPDPGWVAQVQAMCTRLYPAGLNIDYYPTNFVPRDGTLYYIDYECSAYMEPWDFEHWGLPVWTAQAAERTEDA